MAFQHDPQHDRRLAGRRLPLRGVQHNAADTALVLRQQGQADQEQGGNEGHRYQGSGTGGRGQISKPGGLFPRTVKGSRFRISVGIRILKP